MPRNSLTTAATISLSVDHYHMVLAGHDMSRYRPPAPKRSNFITPEGARALRHELRVLWREKRPAVAQSVAEAAAQGDRSENAEYIYGKRQLADIDRRVRFLRKRLDGIRVVDRVPDDTSKVYFGAWFDLEDESQEIRSYRLVGPDEIDMDSHYVSLDSPLGSAVVGKSAGATVAVDTPRGQTSYTIRDIRYATNGEKKPGRRPG
jgi:transcription elongation factor GreB